VPKVVEFMDHLPTSAVGKVLKRDLKKILETKY
jgi:non-ribosomal peptide synthetase component E (peptide arylation enzyme)